MTGATVTGVTDAADHATVHYRVDGRDLTADADAVLVATGRRPATAGLGLEAAEIRTTESGAIAVDEYLRTSQPHVFAVGDVNGGPQYTYISLDDSRIVGDQLTGSGTRTTRDREAVPYTVFTTPCSPASGSPSSRRASRGTPSGSRRRRSPSSPRYPGRRSSGRRGG